jgi:23S rRNA pseudouridine1911/1915/1917 synthase
MTGRKLDVVVPEVASGTRLDRFLADSLNEPRSQIQRWIREGLVAVEGRAAKPSQPVSPGERIDVRPPGPSPDERVEPEPGDLVILHEDDQIIVIDKPAGLPMHPGAGRPTGTLAHRLLAAFPEIEGVGGPGRPGIVHRLDIDTTGVVVIARNAAAYRALSEDFSERRVEKTYLALCYGAPRPAEGSWTGPIARHPTRRKEMAVRQGGRRARTDYVVRASVGGVSLLKLVLGTGRTHQIRVHLKEAGHPLVGDPVYGEARWKGLERRLRGPLSAFPRPALHAWKLGFRHPGSGDPVEFVAVAPADLRGLWSDLGGGPELNG